MSVETVEPVELSEVGYVHRSIDDAIVAALGELSDPKAGETADTGQYSYKYATLAQTMQLVRPVLARHGLAVMQVVHSLDEQLAVQTVIRHSSGGTIESGWLMSRQPPNAQQTGSTITYFRRYQLCALLGIAPDDDDDGKAASAVTQPARRRASPAQERVDRRTGEIAPRARPRAAAEITDAQRRHIMAMFSALGLNGDAQRTARLAYTSNAIGREIESTNEITRDEARVLIEALIVDTNDVLDAAGDDEMGG